MNIFGGIVRCDLVAEGILDALTRVDLKVPMVVRLDGTNAAGGTQDPRGREHRRRRVVPDDVGRRAARRRTGAWLTTRYRREVEQRVGRPFDEGPGAARRAVRPGVGRGPGRHRDRRRRRRGRTHAEVIAGLLERSRAQAVAADARRSARSIRWIGKPWRERENPWDTFKDRVPPPPPRTDQTSRKISTSGRRCVPTRTERRPVVSTHGDPPHRRHARLRPGTDRARGHLPRHPQPRVRHEDRGRRHARQRRTDARSTDASPCSTPSPKRRTRRAATRA